MIRLRAWWCPFALLLTIIGWLQYRPDVRSLVEPGPEPTAPNNLPSSSRQPAPIHDADALPWLVSDAAQPVSLKFQFADARSITLHLRPSAWLPANFTIATGPDGQTLPLPTQAWQGFAFGEGQQRPAAASLIRVGPYACAQVIESSGATLTLPLDPSSTQVNGWLTPIARGSYCELSHHGPHGLNASIRSEEMLHDTAMPITAKLEVAAQGGYEPGTGLLDRYVDPIPLAERYQLSLKDLSLLLVMDQQATGSSAPDNLAFKASQWLATVANVATVYENQLGIRLRLQELVMIPEDPAFEDVPFDDLFTDFLSWLSVHRPQNMYGWTSAIKIGQGLVPNELGTAFVGSIGRNDSVALIRSTAGWDTLAHELGHALGAGHTVGGIMNRNANGGGNRSFFTRAIAAKAPTAAEEIYNHARNRLGGAAALRNPLEMPFAQNDFRRTETNTAVRFLPLTNDQRAAPNGGQWNASISLDEVSSVMPPTAGTAHREQDTLVFTPSPDYVGSAWLSYSLRGSLGNDGNGWLHKGDVSILVGTPETRSYELTLSPSQVFTFFPEATRGGSLQQPEQAQVQWLPDTDGQLLIRVRDDARGTDKFTINGQTYHISYQDQSSRGVDSAIYWQHPQLGMRRYYVGSRLIQSDPWIGDSINGTSMTFFPSSVQLISAELQHLDKGTLEFPKLPVTRKGLSVLLPTGELRFTPNLDANGIAVIDLVLEDASGARHSRSLTIHLVGDAETLINTNAPVRYSVPRTAADANRWMLNAFDDRTWSLGALPIGYEDGSGYEDVINTSVARQMVDQNASIYLRIPFQVDNPSIYTDLILRARIDDGLVAYLNGREILRENAPADLTWSSNAMGGREAGDAIDYGISDARRLLFKGKNLLAIHGLNASKDSSDFLIMPEFLALRSPRLATITSPTVASVSIPAETGILFQATLNSEVDLPVTGKVTTTWQIIEAPASQQPVRIDSNETQAAIAFPTPGTYRVRMSAQDTTKITTYQDVVVRVGTSQTFDHLGDRIVAGPDTSTTSPVITLTGMQAPGTPGFEGRPAWSQISGPSGVTFSAPSQLQTTATLPSKGTYRLRLSSVTEQLTVFDDVIVRYEVAERQLIGPNAKVHFHIPSESAPFGWQQRDFDDLGWHVGTNGLGYDTTNNFAPYLATDLREELHFRHSSLLLRYPFYLDQIDSIEDLTLTMLADDGYVAYLNGREVARQNAPLTQLDASSHALQAVDEATFNNPLAIDLTEYQSFLEVGRNVLAVHGLNQSASSTDFLIHTSLTATSPAVRSSPNAFADWIASFPTLPESERLPESDGDRDGLGNLLEYALGTSPIARDADLAWSIKRSPNANTFTLRHRQRANLNELGGTLTVETCTSLQQADWEPWQADSIETRVLNQEWSSSIYRGSRQQSAQFFRLRVAF